MRTRQKSYVLRHLYILGIAVFLASCGHRTFRSATLYPDHVFDISALLIAAEQQILAFHNALTAINLEENPLQVDVLEFAIARELDSALSRATKIVALFALQTRRIPQGLKDLPGAQKLPQRGRHKVADPAVDAPAQGIPRPVGFHWGDSHMNSRLWQHRAGLS